MNLIIKLLKFCLYIIDLPFILSCNEFGKNSHVGIGYSLFFSSKKGVSIGSNVSIGKNSVIQTVNNSFENKPVVRIANNTMIGKDFFCSSAKKIIIGSNSLFSTRVSVIDHDHNFSKSNSPIHEQGITEGQPIIIGDYSFIGIGAVILKGVKLGKHCVVGANSVVTKSFPDYSIIGGIPAKKIGENIVK